MGPAAGAVNVSSMSGDISVVVAPGPGPRDVEIVTTSGDVTLILPTDFSGSFELDVGGAPGSGRIRSDFPLSESSGFARERGGRVQLTGQVGTGSHLVRIRNGQGDVTIRRADRPTALSPLPARSPSGERSSNGARELTPVTDNDAWDEFGEHVAAGVLDALRAAVDNDFTDRVLIDFSNLVLNATLTALPDSLAIAVTTEIARDIQADIDIDVR